MKEPLADQIRLYIRSTMEHMKQLEYGQQSDGCLPLREDVYRAICYRFCRTFGADLSRVDYPLMLMHRDGTVLMEFHRAGRVLALSFPCEGVVVYSRRFSDKVTVIDGCIRIDYDKSEPWWSEVNELLDWCFPKRKQGKKHEEEHKG